MNTQRSNSVPEQLTKREVAEIAIRNAIEAGLYRPGQVVSQRQISEDLGLSVTPIREAVLVLTGNGIVERHKHHSIKVSEIDERRLREIFSVRHMLEEEAVRLATKNATPDLVKKLTKLNRQLEIMSAEDDPAEINPLDRAFHRAIFQASDNAALVWTIDRVKSSFPMYALWGEAGRIATSVSEHRKLISAIESGDAEASAAAQRRHLANGLEALISYLQRTQPPAE
ncbi:GntR family transcriptional regulator [Roseovarius sp. CAU 1744]|uniref:GntR family transcriptional regulator n=1 Tax=Roseovarius sp. CAU 1744 TaxID=3140368 RepID=UPI00325B5CAF